jgi:internalin A
LTKLEELSLENNFLTSVQGLDTLSSLRRLNVSRNDIHDFDGQTLTNLTRLTYLAIDHNRLSTLAKLSRSLTLIELYAGNNSIRNIRDIFHLKVILTVNI